MSIYALKGRFQNLLRPGVACMARGGITANQVTLGAALGSLIIAWWVWAHAPTNALFYLLLPGWMLLRMALNAVDGMLAREFGQQSKVGAYLNELGDVVADTALFLALLSAPGMAPVAVWALVVGSALTEYAGVLGLMVGASRRYDGPMGKSDRALIIGLIGVALSMGWINGANASWVIGAAAALCGTTVLNRVIKGLEEASNKENAA